MKSENQTKRGVRPTRRQKIVISQHRLAAENWLVVKDNGLVLILQNKESGRKRQLRYG
ncbi:DUF6906 family protein [Paenibacillus woosongensis]|uniref:DUF6906 domain-containing protein n=1 Tax=Paenibacillus woosongensis TaxID=307580 RepID=A0ABQ4MYY6_9BACL|nr:hypothetical protein J15TS10_49640 [Paenibacillus woosongensis]